MGEGKLAHNRFDRVLLVTVLGEIPDREAALGENFAALKPGGILSVTGIIFDPHLQRLSTVNRLANAVGFEEVVFLRKWCRVHAEIKETEPCKILRQRVLESHVNTAIRDTMFQLLVVVSGAPFLSF